MAFHSQRYKVHTAAQHLLRHLQHSLGTRAVYPDAKPGSANNTISIVSRMGMDEPAAPLFE
jgi:hypothetical protein